MCSGVQRLLYRLGIHISCPIQRLSEHFSHLNVVSEWSITVGEEQIFLKRLFCFALKINIVAASPTRSVVVPCGTVHLVIVGFLRQCHSFLCPTDSKITASFYCTEKSSFMSDHLSSGEIPLTVLITFTLHEHGTGRSHPGVRFNMKKQSKTSRRNHYSPLDGRSVFDSRHQDSIVDHIIIRLLD